MNKDRAAFGKNLFQDRQEFKKYSVNKLERQQLTGHQQWKKVGIFGKVTKDLKVEILENVLSRTTSS